MQARPSLQCDAPHLPALRRALAGPDLHPPRPHSARPELFALGLTHPFPYQRQIACLRFSSLRLIASSSADHALNPTCSMLGAVTTLGSLNPVFRERALFYRETSRFCKPPLCCPTHKTSSGMYLSRTFLAAAGIVEIPFVLISTIIFSVTFYWLVDWVMMRAC